MSHSLKASADFSKQKLKIYIDKKLIKTLDFSAEQNDPDIYQGDFNFKPKGAKKKITYDVLFERSNKTNPKVYIYPIYGDEHIENKVVEVTVKK